MENLNIQHDIIHKIFFLRTPSGVAKLEYSKPERDKMELTRTYVPENDRHKGIGSALADRAINYARERYMKIRPACPFVRDYLDQHSIETT